MQVIDIEVAASFELSDRGFCLLKHRPAAEGRLQLFVDGPGDPALAPTRSLRPVQALAVGARRAVSGDRGESEAARRHRGVPAEAQGFHQAFTGLICAS
jgi:hypothetical protein